MPVPPKVRKIMRSRIKSQRENYPRPSKINIGTNLLILEIEESVT